MSSPRSHRILWTLVCFLAVLAVTPAYAAIKVTSRPVVQVPPPLSVRPEAYTSNTEIRAFDETQNVITPVPITVNISEPGTYSSLLQLTPGVIPAGTCVQSQFLHLDNVGVTQMVRLEGSVTFDADVLGIIVLSPNLDLTDDLLGVQETDYPTGSFPLRGVELQGSNAQMNPDVITLDNNLRTVTVNLEVVGALDSIRVITECAEDPPAQLDLAPEVSTNPVGTEHCVTATVTDADGDPTPNILVRFSVTGSVNTTGSGQTDNDGTAEFCYMGPPLPGTDVITAFADTDGDGTRDLGEPGDVASKLWVLPETTPGCEIKITNGGWITAINGDKATFGGNAKASESGDTTGQQEYQDHGPVQPVNVHSLNVLAIVCSADRTEAQIYGEARMNNVEPVFYRIRVRDNGEPGTNDMYGIILTGYASGDRKLEGGNIQIR